MFTDVTDVSQLHRQCCAKVYQYQVQGHYAIASNANQHIDNIAILQETNFRHRMHPKIYWQPIHSLPTNATMGILKILAEINIVKLHLISVFNLPPLHCNVISAKKVFCLLLAPTTYFKCASKL